MKLRTRFILVISLLYVVVGAASIYGFFSGTETIIESFARRFAAKEAEIQKNRILTLIDREVVLAQKMAGDDLIRRWVLEEQNSGIQAAAIHQIEGYRSLLHDRESFLTSAQSLHYYTFTGKNSAPIVTTLSPSNPENRWFFETMKDVDDYALNLDYDPLIKKTKVWINAVMRGADGRKIAIIGAGVDISTILEDIILKHEPGISVILIDGRGIIQACDDRSIVQQNATARVDEKKIRIFALLQGAGIENKLNDAIDRLKTGSPDDPDVITFPVTMDGRDKIAAVSYMNRLGWYNIGLVDVTRVLSGREFLPILATFFLSLLFLTVLLGALMHRLVLQPLERLTTATADVATGRYDVQLPVERRDELGMLTSTFNKMTSTIREYTGDLEEKVRRRTEDLSRTNDELQQSQKSMAESLEYAAIIQSSILPDRSLFESCFREHLLIYRPRYAVGGDFHYLRCEGERTILAAVDCTGHGVPGAFMTMTAASTLNHIVDSTRTFDPAEILGEMNRILKETLHFRDIDAGLDIALCVIDRTENKLLFSGAGLSLFVVREDTVTEQKGDIQRIGYRNSRLEFKYRTHEFALIRGLTFFLTTDGILDEPGGDRGFGFGTDRFIGMLQDCAKRPLVTQATAFESMIARYRGARDRRDDITVIGFRV